MSMSVPTGTSMLAEVTSVVTRSLAIISVNEYKVPVCELLRLASERNRFLQGSYYLGPARLQSAQHMSGERIGPLALPLPLTLTSPAFGSKSKTLLRAGKLIPICWMDFPHAPAALLGSLFLSRLLLSVHC